MKTYREYSDLSDSQKLIYIKRSVVLGICMFIPISLVFAGFGMLLTVYYDPVHEQDLMLVNSTSSESIEPDLRNSDIMILGLVTMFFGAIYGFVHIGGELGYYLLDKFGLYTDINLDSAERHLKRVKESVQKEETK